MSEDGVKESGPKGQTIRLGGKNYVLIPKEEYEQLKRHVPCGPPATFVLGSIGPDLRGRRLKASLTLKVVSARAGIRLETLSRIETGRSNPSARTVQAVLRALEELL
jgi:hypothetical protein